MPEMARRSAAASAPSASACSAPAIDTLPVTVRVPMPARPGAIVLFAAALRLPSTRPPPLSVQAAPRRNGARLVTSNTAPAETLKTVLEDIVPFVP